MLRGIVVLVALLCVVSGAQAAVITLQNGTAGYTGCNETWMWEAFPNDAWGGAAWGSSIGMYSCVGRSLLKFDVSSIAPGTPVASAKIRLNMCVAGTSSVDAYQVLKQWNMASATWNSAATGDPWNVPGTAGAGTDRAASAFTTVGITAADLNRWVDVPLPVSMVQDWVNGTAVNAGVLFQANPDTTWNVRYCNDNWSDLSLSPMLVIEAVPEPMTLLLLAAGGGLAALRRHVR